MPPEPAYTVKYIGLPPEDYTNRDLLIGISLDNPKLTRGYFAAYLKGLIEKHFHKIQILICDGVHVHNLKVIYPELNEQALLALCYRKALYWIIVNSDAFLKRDMLLEKHHGTWRELLPLIDPESLSSDELPEVLISMPDEVVYAKLQELVEFFNTNATEYKESKKFELVLWSKIPQELRKKAMRKGERLYNSKKAHRQAFKSLIDETVRDHVKRAGLSDSKDIDTFTKASYAHVMEEFPVVARYAEKNRFHFVCFVGTEDPAWRAVKEDMVHGPYYFNLVQAEIKQVKSVQYERESSAQLPKENSKGSEKQQTKSDRKDEGKKEPTVLVQHPNIKFSIPLYTGEEYGRGKSSCRSCVGGASYLNPEKRCFTKASRVDYSHSGG